MAEWGPEAANIFVFRSGTSSRLPKLLLRRWHAEFWGVVKGGARRGGRGRWVWTKGVKGFLVEGRVFRDPVPFPPSVFFFIFIFPSKFLTQGKSFSTRKPARNSWTLKVARNFHRQQEISVKRENLPLIRRSHEISSFAGHKSRIRAILSLIGMQV